MAKIRPLPKRSTPPDSAKTLEEAKKILDNSAQTNRNLFIAFNFVLLTVLVLTIKITDEELLLGNATLKIPLLNIDLPIWAFATVAPLALVALHFDLLHNLTEHKAKLIAWAEAWLVVYPRRAADMPKQCFPFLFDFACLHARYTGETAFRARLLPALCWLLYCWAAYSVLVIIFIRFADLQHYGYTGWHVFLLFFSPMIYLSFFGGTTANFAAQGSDALDVTDRRGGLMATEKVINEAAISRYEFIRNSYLQHRNYLVYDGNPPDELDINDKKP